MARLIQIDGQVPFRAFKSPETGRWIAVCDALRITVDGADWGELTEVIAETLSLLLHDLLASGELQSFLREHGWKIATGRIPKTVAARKNVRFNLPFVVAPEQLYGRQAAAYQ